MWHSSQISSPLGSIGCHLLNSAFLLKVANISCGMLCANACTVNYSKTRHDWMHNPVSPAFKLQSRTTIACNSATRALFCSVAVVCRSGDNIFSALDFRKSIYYINS